MTSDKLGAEYKNDMFVGDVHNGRIYHFKLNSERTDLGTARSTWWQCCKEAHFSWNQRFDIW